MSNSSRESHQTVPTIVVSRPGILQQSLRVVLTNCPEINVVTYTGDALNAMLQVRQHHPGLLVIDHNLLDEEIHALLLAVKDDFPATQCLVISSSRGMDAPLTAWGADAVVLRNAPPQELKAALLQLAHKASLLSE